MSDDQEPGLRYPLDEHPEPGDALELAPGLLWLRLSLPFQLAHINVWLLREGDGWALVDTGLFTNTTREVWKHVLERILGGIDDLAFVHLTAADVVRHQIVADNHGWTSTLDEGEPGIPGVTVALLDDTGKVIATTTI